MAKDRLPLTSLSERLARKTSGQLDSKPAAKPRPKPRPRAEDGKRRVQIIVRMTLAERKALRQIALDRDTTAQALAEDAIRNVLRRHGVKTD